MNKLFLHEAYKDKTDEELIALRKSHFQITDDSKITIGVAQQYYDFLCLPPGTEWEDNQETRILNEKMDALCRKLQYLDYAHYPDSPRWSAVNGLIEIINDYPEITTKNIDFACVLDGLHFDEDVFDVIHGINDDARRLEFTTFFYKHFNLFNYKECFLNGKRKPDTIYIKQFKEQLCCEIEQIKDIIKQKTPPKPPRTTCPTEYNITIEDFVCYAYSEEGKDIRERMNPILRYFTTEKGWKWEKVNMQVNQVKKKLGVDGLVNFNNPTIQEMYLGDKVNHKK